MEGASQRIKIGIVGGGVQGLSLAYFLSKNPKYAVTLFERNKNLGGLLGLLEINGTGFEGFYHHWSGHDTDIMELVEELGLGNRLTRLSSKTGIFYGEKIYPFGTPMDLLRFSPLGLIDRIRVGLTVLYLKHVKDWRKYEKVAASDWLKKTMGQRAYDVIWEPLLRGKFGQHKEEVSMAWMWHRLSWRANARGKGAVKEELVYPRYGFKPIIDALVKKIQENSGTIKTSIVIDSIFEENGKVAIASGEQEEIFDKVFVTTPVNVFSRLVKNLPADYLENLKQIKYRAAHVTILVMNHSLMPQGYYWLNINNRDIPLLAVIEHTNLLPKEDYGGKTLVYLGNYPDPNDEIMKMDNEKVIELYCRHLPKINPEFKKEWIDQYFIFKDPAAQPIVDTGYAANIPDHQTPIPNLYLVTMAQIYPEDRGTSKAIEQSKKVLEKLGL
ncbi:MAG: NAD(P)/FAD-dependent oxidoreductase [Patescibacteria group bacterium]